jgi:hypothetical protein
MGGDRVDARGAIAFATRTPGFNAKTWLDGSGMPHSEALRLTERIRRLDFGHMEIAYTCEDQKAFTAPWSATVKFELQPGTKLLEHQCENDKWQAAGGSAPSRAFDASGGLAAGPSG